MKILVLNGSPKGAKSTTLQTSLYLEALHPEHEFTILHVGQRIKALERDFSPVEEGLNQAELVIFSYPVYTFFVPYQLHRTIELIKERCPQAAKGKFVTQISTSKHFYDVTAHRFIEENCNDLDMNVIRGLSADMDDLLSEKGQKEARDFLKQVIFSCENSLFVPKSIAPPVSEKPVYSPSLKDSEKRGRDVVIVATYEPDENARSDADASLVAMIEDFRRAIPYSSRVINIREFKFSGGCLGCLSCAFTGECVYKDGFDDYLRTQIQQADAMIYAFSIENHYAHSSFKCFDDRQFCNGHRTVTAGTPVGYLLTGNYAYEQNLKMAIEGRSEVGGNYLCGVATNEGDTAQDILELAKELEFAVENKLSRPANFYGVGGMKIFRDLIYLMQGMMTADHKFYKENGLYDFPQNQKKTILLMKLVGAMFKVPALAKQAKQQMAVAMVAPYEKVINAAKDEAGKA